MDTTILGRTGLNVSVMGVGAGGPSRLGQRTNRTEAESIAIIQQALDTGVNFIDTAEVYGTEELVGRAIKPVGRDKVIISTKKSSKAATTPQDVQTSLEASLTRLQTDYIDIYNLHGVRPEDYDYLLAEIVPTFIRLQEQGKIRFIGITELFNADLTHTMLHRALQDDVWDVVMVGFNILNQTARETVFAQTLEKNIGTQIMFAVRAAFSQPQRLAEAIKELIEQKQLDPSEIDVNDPLDFLVKDGHAASLTDAAYRFCRYEPGAHVILSGTGNPSHLQANIESLSRPPLPDEVVTKLRHLFRKANAVSGQ